MSVQGKCDECGSTFNAGTSGMENLCVECSSVLYGKRACNHSLIEGRCETCGWDGSRSDYIRGLVGEPKHQQRG